MGKPIDRTDKNPWEKMHAISSVKELVGKGDLLSTHLRMTRFSPVGGRVKKPAVDWICAGQQRAVSSPGMQQSDLEVLTMRLRSRMMVNHSGGVMENATLALHPHFGTPFIPGSAVKGIARHTAWCDWKDADNDDQSIYMKLIADVFGFPTGDRGLDGQLKAAGITSAQSGAVAFLPAHCVGTATLEADIVNSHESRKPIPVFFPAVAANTEFLFRLLPLKRKTHNEKDTIVEFACTWLRRGLREHGAGAKTRAGYGWFEEVE
jgi:CRISPR type III-B/RAMP module RAMP protein Cmr6